MPQRPTPNYLFVARESASNKMVELDIREHTPDTHNYLKDVCSKMSQAIKGFYKKPKDEPCPGWAEWDVVSWSQKPIVGRHKFAAWTGDVMAGFVWIRHGFPSHYHPGQTVTYVELMSVTPTNMQTKIWSRCLEAVGVPLLAYSALQSHRNGHKGNFSLHAADEVATSYYKHVNETFENQLFEKEILGVAGVEPRIEQGKGSPYFETKLEGAIALLGEYENG